MNIKKFFMIAYIAFQSTQYSNASSQTAYNAAFQAFNAALNKGAATTIAQVADFISNNRGAFNWTETQKIALKLNSPQAMAVGMYLSSGNPATLFSHFANADVIKQGKSVSFSNLLAALTAAKLDTTPIAALSTTPGTTPSTTPGTTPSTTPGTTGGTTTPSTTPQPSPIDTAAATLKTQIESAKKTYNSYLSSRGLPALYTAQ
jgi:hypothetical protein